jgi:DNA repair exonuclease SbcCD nuclease subunit
MKAHLILTSDWHIRETIPECRTDDFWETQWEKVMFVNKLQREHGCPVVHAGDLFHHWKPSPYLLSYTIDYLPEQFHTIYGQHDLPQHNLEQRQKSGINVLHRANKVTVLPGVHWGQDPPSDNTLGVHVSDYVQRLYMIWHHMVWQGKRPWPGCTDPSATAVLKKYKNYDLILTGDNHKPFVEEYEGRLLVNPGSLTRQTADQINHLPRVYLYDAHSNAVEPVYLPIQKGDEVISREHIDKNEERGERIAAFITKLGGEWEVSLSFEDNLKRFFQSNKVLDSVKQIVWGAIDNE